MNASKQMRLVKLSINWGQATADKLPPGTVPLNPSLSDRRLTSTSWHQPGPTNSPLDPAMGMLSLVEILPSTLENDANSWAPPLILLARSHIGPPGSPYQEPQSIIDRWLVLTDQKQSVHPAFLSLGSQKPSAGAELPVCTDNFRVPQQIDTDPIQTTTNLRRQESIVFNKLIVGIQPITQGKVICITFADGTVEYRDRLTMAETYNEPSPDRVMSLTQAGFSFMDPTPSKYLLISCRFLKQGNIR